MIMNTISKLLFASAVALVTTTAYAGDILRTLPRDARDTAARVRQACPAEVQTS